jgi:hypothetical protein
MKVGTSIRPWLLFALSACQSTAQSSSNVSDKQTETSSPPSAAAASCGGKTQPDCPLQGWMKSTLQPYQREKNFGRLATELKKLAEHAPEGYANWKETALAGVAAAEAKDDTAVSKNCKSCHNEHRTRFRKERRAEPLF